MTLAKGLDVRRVGDLRRVLAHDGVLVHAGRGFREAGADARGELVDGRRLPLDHARQVARGGAAGGDEDELVGALRALVGEEGRDPAAHRVADEVRPLDAEGVHELAHVVDEVGEGELDVEDVAGAPVQAVDGEDAEACLPARQARREVGQVRQPDIGAGVEAGAVQEDRRVSRTRFEVARPAVA